MDSKERALQQARLSQDEALALALKLSAEGRLPNPYSASYRSEIDAMRAEYLRNRDGK